MATVANIFQGTSTNLDTRYLLSQFIPTVTITDNNGNPLNVLEPFNPAMINAINSLSRIGYQLYKGEPITTISYNKYRNTTCWWMIMLMSQLIHPLIIAIGFLLQIPDNNMILQSLSPAVNTGQRIPKYTTI
jgi:hypothetical protein